MREIHIPITYHLQNVRSWVSRDLVSGVSMFKVILACAKDASGPISNSVRASLSSLPPWERYSLRRYTMVYHQKLAVSYLSWIFVNVKKSQVMNLNGRSSNSSQRDGLESFWKREGHYSGSFYHKMGPMATCCQELPTSYRYNSREQEWLQRSTQREIWRVPARGWA